MSKILLIIGLAVFMLPACSNLAITDIKVVEDCGQCMTWQTTEPARCRITYCDDNQCYSSEWEPYYGTLHCYGLPRYIHDIKILSLNRGNHLIETEVKP